MNSVQTEWDTLPASGKHAEMQLFVARPGGDEPRPVVVVIHEAFGLDPHIQDIARRFAAAGFVAIAPNLFWLDSAGRTVQPAELMRLMRMRMSLPRDQWSNPGAFEIELAKLPADQAQRLRAVGAWQGERDEEAWVPALHRLVDWSRERAFTTGKVGVTGYCLGGGVTFKLAFSGADINAAAPFYGQNPTLDQVGNVHCPLLVMYGRKDPYIMPGVPALLTALQGAELDFGLHIFEEAGHAFLNDTRPEAYHAGAAQEAWTMTVSFFDRHLQ